MGIRNWVPILVPGSPYRYPVYFNNGVDMKVWDWELIDPEMAHWEVDATKDLSAFLRALPIISPIAAMIYFEAGSPDEEIADFFTARGEPGLVIPMGSADPNPT